MVGGCQYAAERRIVWQKWKMLLSAQMYKILHSRQLCFLLLPRVALHVAHEGDGKQAISNTMMRNIKECQKRKCTSDCNLFSEFDKQQKKMFSPNQRPPLTLCMNSGGYMSFATTMIYKCFFWAFSEICPRQTYYRTSNFIQLGNCTL